MKIVFLFALLFVAFVFAKNVPLTEKEKGWLKSSSRENVNGWIHVKVSGDPYPRGFQVGLWNEKIPFL